MMTAAIDEPFTFTEADRERGRQHRTRIQSRDWREVPKGHYAIPVPGLTSWSAGDMEGEIPVIGYRLFQRKVARHCKTGRTIGKDQFVTGRVMYLPDADPAEVRREVQSDDDSSKDVFGPGGDLKAIVDDILRDIAEGDTYRAKFGQLTGKCGCCGMRLTDPKSKMLGIGPDCRGYR